jgi:UDP-N-acetylmuramoyl-L-alanyl-D-glutamate--2,6-diaminopimelate ligase
MEVTPDEQIRNCYQFLKTIAVTGTNGKSTTTSMLASIVKVSGESYAKMTTLGANVNGVDIDEDRSLYRYLKTVTSAVEVGVKTLTLEVTSKALSKGFAQRWPPHVAIFTNLSRDHLDMHGTPEEYLASKAQLFMNIVPKGTAILNADDPSSELLQMVLPKDTKVLTYSLCGKTATLSAQSVDVSLKGTKVCFYQSETADLLGGELMLQVVGDVQGANAMAATLGAMSLGYSPDYIRQGLYDFQTLPGRFDIVSTKPLVIVDYAHTPDGLKGTLKTARSLCTGTLFCIFGCGGERDQGKRPQMGAVADLLSDIVVLTSDNPRRENPQKIAEQVIVGSRNQAKWKIEHNRRTAISWALCIAKEQDIIVIAGKGHEKEQSIGTKVYPFCDTSVVRDILSLGE